MANLPKRKEIKMKKEFTLYNILNAKELIKNNSKLNDDNFKFKRLNSKNKEYFVLSKKSFKKYNETCDTKIVGSIRKRQRRYKDYEDYNELVSVKTGKKIFGKATLDILDNSEKYYDVKEVKNSYTYGYAWVGKNNFLQVKTFNPLLIFLPLLLAVIIALLLSFCHNNPIDEPLDIVDGTEISDDDTNNNDVEDIPLCYFEPFDETTTLTKDNKEIVLKNLEINEGKYLCSYEIIIDGNSIHTMGAILPNNAVKYDLWSQLDEGTYTLVCKSTEYDYETHQQYNGHYNLTTTLVVEK